MDRPEVVQVAPETTIDDLPNELLIPIFNRLPNDSLQSVSLVSDRWKSIVKEEIGCEIFVSDFGNLRGYLTPRKLKEGVIKICHIRMITSDDISDLKKPDKLKVLYFKAPVTARVFQTLTCKTFNLTKIYFLHASLSSDIKTANSPALNLPNLKLLHLCDRSLESGDATHPGFIPSNINFLLEQSFPSIRELVVSTVSDRTSTRAFGLNLLYFVQEHHNTLQTLKFSVATTILGVPFFAPNIFDLYESMDLTRQERSRFEWNKLSKVSFKALELDFGKNYVVGLLEWSRILECQNTLHSAFLFKEAPVPLALLASAILLSCRNLVYVHLGVQITDDDFNITPIDCTLFQVCSGLRKFGLCGNGGPDRPLKTELINCHKLPRTILALLLRNISVESTNLETMIFQLNYVVKLTLDGIGSKDQFGMTLKLLDKVMTAKKCLEMIVKTFNNVDAEDYPDLVNEFEKESFTVATLPNCHFHAKFSDELNQYIFICV